ncbi:MAG: alkene reductase [Candidatus Andeanibacterium colombiense]|uniref:Alkene reductase n=1 Tax=Candidatus Andeanibacterium colombiense TaxID=3121345 RepID=A0AAJ5X4F9_9SPHN|nr:MAG: alkene reductase [Sphingomonadaceae bacterium]
MTRSRTPGGVPNALNAEYYAQRASAGLVFAESTAISPYGVGFTDTPGIFSDEQAAGWAKVTDAVHRRGGHIVLQLWHSGHYSHRSLLPGGALPIGPSARPVSGTVWTPLGPMEVEVPRALEQEGVPQVLDEYRVAAKLALAANFDAVEVHAGNGYLIDQFLRDSTNHRTDEYGGPPENRMRLLLEVVEAVSSIWGRERVGVRLSPTNPSVFGIMDSQPEVLFPQVVDALERAGIGFLDMVEGGTGDSADQCPFDYEALRRRFSGVYIANNRFTQESAECAVAEGRADMIAFGRSFIANPDLVERFRRRAPLNPIAFETLRGPGAEGYLDYPTLA